MEKKLRKLMIVIEETGTDGGKGFITSLKGDTERLRDPLLKYDELSPAEFWGSRLFDLCAQVLAQTGVAKTKITEDGRKVPLQPQKPKRPDTGAH